MKRINMTKQTLLTALFVGAVILSGCDSGDQTQTPATIMTATAIIQPTDVAPTATVAASGSDTAPTEAAPQATGEPTATQTTASGGSGPTAAADCTKLNLNSVTEAQLLSAIPGFGDRMVREFMEYRPYASIQQFRREIGKYVDDATIAEYEKYVYVPVDFNSSDADSLQQMPGVDSAVAANLVAARPYASSTAFLDALGKQVSAEQLSAAGCFMAINP